MFKKLKQKIAEESEGEQSPRRQNPREGQVKILISYTRECSSCMKVLKQSKDSVWILCVFFNIKLAEGFMVFLVFNYLVSQRAKEQWKCH